MSHHRLPGRSNRYLSSEVRASRRAIFCSSSTVRRSRPPVTKRNNGWRRLALGKTSRKANVPLKSTRWRRNSNRRTPRSHWPKKNMRVKRTSRIPPERRPNWNFFERGPDDQARQRVAQLEAELATSRLGRARIKLPPKPMLGRWRPRS